MCRYCRRSETERLEMTAIKERVQREFGLRSIVVTDSSWRSSFKVLDKGLLVIEMRYRQKKIARRLVLLVKRRKALAPGVSAWKIDYERDLLRFAAWVMYTTRENMRKGDEPWLNGGALFVA